MVECHAEPLRWDREPGSSEAVGSVYVHAPFCRRRCFYCDFPVTVTAAPDTEAWLKALSGELERVLEEGHFYLSPLLDTLYVGGGTPSSLAPEAMAGVASLLTPARLQADRLEWTVEANPESFSPVIASSWRRSGVNRVSIGIQSFEPSVLRWMGRLHTEREAIESVQVARDAGFENLNIDLMFGLPERVKRDLRLDLDRFVSLGVPHISVYGLTFEEGSGLGTAAPEGTASLPSQERYAEEYLEVSCTLTGAGYVQYEVSNFALPGFESAHNRAYWALRPYLGLGNGAHSYLHPLRRWNLRDWSEYQEAALSGGDTRESEEILEAAAARLERVWLGLRTRRGLDLDSAPEPALATVTDWVERGWADLRQGVVSLAPQGWLLLDRLAVELDSALAK